MVVRQDKLHCFIRQQALSCEAAFAVALRLHSVKATVLPLPGG